ncbi:MAG TPA: histidine phosphatase family protein [Cyclobacteriaceae bacterium]
MKKLYVIRHAKSSWDSPLLDDFDRPLNERGERDAPRMAKRLKEKRIVPDLMLSSPANRALTTCIKIADVLQYQPEKIKTDETLYHADEDEILGVVKKLNDKHDEVIIFGHNPGLTDFINKMTDARIDNIPTCGVVACVFEVDSWKKISWGSGKVDFFDYPKLKK